MARQKKIGLDYAPQDTDIHADRKVRRLLSEFGATGYLVYDYIKCQCYKENGYWLKYDDGFCFDVADVLKSGTTESSVLEILKGCFRMDLFNRSLFKAFRVISSRGIQKRFLEVRKDHLLIQDYDLITGFSDENEDLSTENDPLVHKQKESKQKEKKENESKAFACAFADWNLFAEKNGRAKISEMHDTRKTKLRSRFKEEKFSLQKILIIADASEFITGKDGGWFTFDWVIDSQSNYLKVLEGNYNGTGTTKTNGRTKASAISGYAAELAAKLAANTSIG